MPTVTLLSKTTTIEKLVEIDADEFRKIVINAAATAAASQGGGPDAMDVRENGVVEWQTAPGDDGVTRIEARVRYTKTHRHVLTRVPPDEPWED